MATRWQLFSTHIHTNNTGNVTKQTIHRTTQKIHRTTQQLGRVRAMSRLCGFYPGICLTTEHCCVIFFVYESTDYTKLVRAMAQGFSRWSHSREAMVRPQESRCEMCVRQSSTETGFLLRAPRLSFVTAVHQLSIHLPPTLYVYNPGSWLSKTLPHQCVCTAC